MLHIEEGTRNLCYHFFLGGGGGEGVVVFVFYIGNILIKCRFWSDRQRYPMNCCAFMKLLFTFIQRNVQWNKCAS